MAAVIAVIVISFVIGLFRKPEPKPYPGRHSRVMWFIFTILKIYFAIVFGAIISSIGIPAALAVLPVVLWLIFPVTIVQWVLVPLRRPRLVYWARRMTFIEALQPTGPSALHAAIAAGPKADPATIGWIADKLGSIRYPRGAAIVAAGLLADLRGDRSGALDLMRVADQLPAYTVNEGSHLIARERLVADALHQRDWERIIRLGRRGWSSQRWPNLVALIAKRITRRPGAATNGFMILTWLAAPRRRATYPLLRQALAIPRLRKGIMPPPPRRLGLIELIGADGTPEGLSDCVVRFDEDLQSPGSVTHFAQRLADLGSARDVEAVQALARDKLTHWLETVVDARPWLGARAITGSSLDSAVKAERARLFQDIEARTQDLSLRTRQKLTLKAIDEWIAWSQLVGRAERLLALSPDARASLFQVMFVPVNNFAVFQHGSHQRGLLSYSMYTWLLAQADQPSEAAVLLKRNARGVKP